MSTTQFQYKNYCLHSIFIFFYLYAQVFQNYQYLAINPINVKACKENFMLMCAGG